MTIRIEDAHATILAKQTYPVVSLLDTMHCLGEAADFVHPQLAAHHILTGFIAASLAVEMHQSQAKQETLLCAGLVHDIGAFSLKQRLDVARFDAEDVFPHCLTGYELLKEFPSLSHIAGPVRHHHIRWNDGFDYELREDGVFRDGHILHLADRVAVSLLDKKGNPLEIGRLIIAQIRAQSGKMFDPELVDVFRSLASKERFWFEVTAPDNKAEALLPQLGTARAGTMPTSEMAELFSRVIDFRSPFTATHSKSVSAVAETLGQLAGLSQDETKLLNVAGHLHDLGKLGVPLGIIEKPGKLTDREFEVMKRHPSLTAYALRHLDDLEDVRMWSACHHEYLDGSGYPFHLASQEIPFASKILTVSDIFVALTEDRPYRGAMPVDKALDTLESLSRESKVDAHVVALAKDYSSEIYTRIVSVRRPAKENYEAFLDSSFFRAVQ